MNQLVWSKRFIKAVKKVSKRQPDLINKIETALEKLEINHFEPSLRTHKLKVICKELYLAALITITELYLS